MDLKFKSSTKINFTILTTNSIIIFTKNPELGKAKTRVAATLGNVAALDIYKQLLNITRQVITTVDDINRLLFYSDHIQQNDLWPKTLFEKHLQATGDLGNRMKAAFQQAFENADKVLIIGSDCPYITPAIIKNAFKALDDNDVVIGPTYDGGYYLLGMKALHHSLFENIPWSTEDVYPLTLQKIKEAKISYKVAPKLGDVDYAEDWQAYLNWKSQNT